MLTAMARAQEQWLPTRRSLINRLKDWEDQDSWKEFAELYSPLVFGVAIKSGLTKPEAQDVVQQTMLSVAKNIQDFNYDPAIGSFKSWLLHTTKWRITDQFRHRARHPRGTSRRTKTKGRTSTLERIPDPAGFDLDKAWDEEWQKNLFEAALERVKRQVKASQFQMFDLYVLKEWPVDKVASTLGVNPGRIYLCKYRLSRLIKKELKALEAKTL